MSNPLSARLVALALTFAPALGSTAQAAEPKKVEGKPVVLSQRVVEIAGGISFDLMKKAQREVLEFASHGNEPIWLRINSPGGSVDAGLILVDTMKAVKAPIHCIVESAAYSMGAIILSYCDKRYGLPHATYMLHEASYGTAGEDPQNRSKLDFLTKYLDRMHEEIARNLKMDVKKYRARIRDAWWMLSDEAKSIGLIEEIITNIVYEEIPLEKTEEKKTVTIVRDTQADSDRAPIPKRKD
jgi:ATP-dependent Clp protease protease subunit